MPEARREVWYLLETDTIVSGIHPKQWCSGRCVVHRPSNHSMREFPLHFDTKLKAFYRACEHGLLHQDPDERDYWILLLESSKDKASRVLAMEKLGNWPCPECACGCCASHF